ncbi:MAG: hypothetical protein V1781_07420 [Bacteroidota bacterium]
MLTTEQSHYLLRLPKKVELKGKLQDQITFDQHFPFQEKYILILPDNVDFTFLYEIYQSKKNQFKLTLYLMDGDTHIGLLRVDFSGQHENPHMLADTVPAIFHPFVGNFFNYNDHHIHYYVEGYKTTLDWAVPLTNDDFPVKQINGIDDVLLAFYEFNKIINLQTIFKINSLLI